VLCRFCLVAPEDAIKWTFLRFIYDHLTSSRTVAAAAAAQHQQSLNALSSPLTR